MRDGIILLLIPAAAVAFLIYVGVSRITRRRKLRRIAVYAPGEYTFTFASNGWYQAAIQDLRDQGLIERAVGDDPGPLGGGPFWASGSDRAFTIWRGYDSRPLIEIPWSDIDLITDEIPLTENRRYRGETGIDIRVRAPHHPVQLIMFSASGSARVIEGSQTARDVVAELAKRRTAATPAGS